MERSTTFCLEAQRIGTIPLYKSGQEVINTTVPFYHTAAAAKITSDFISKVTIAFCFPKTSFNLTLNPLRTPLFRYRKLILTPPPLTILLKIVEYSCTSAAINIFLTNISVLRVIGLKWPQNLNFEFIPKIPSEINSKHPFYSL